MTYFDESNWFRDSREIFELGLSPYAIAVRVFLAAVANSDGESWYSLDRMQELLNMGRHSLVKAVKELEGRGLLAVRKGRSRKVNLYRLLPVVRDEHCSGADVVRTAHRSESRTVRRAHCKDGVAVRHGPANKNRERKIRRTLARINPLFPEGSLPEGAAGGKITTPKGSDERVTPVLRKFHRCYVEHFNIEPPKAQLDWAREGKRIKDLPEDYTADLLITLIPAFFDSPGYVTRSYRFQDFIEAIPRLMKGANPNGHGGHDSAAPFLSNPCLM